MLKKDICLTVLKVKLKSSCVNGLRLKFSLDAETASRNLARFLILEMIATN